MTNSANVQLSLARVQVMNLLEQDLSSNLIDCSLFKQGESAMLLVYVRSNKPFISKVISNLTTKITKFVGPFKYMILEDETKTRLSPKLAISKFKSQYSTASGNINVMMSRLLKRYMTEPEVKGVELLVKGVLFGNRKSKRKMSEGKQKYTGSYLRDYNLVYKDQMVVPKGANGLTLKVFLKAPAKYDLKAYLDELIDNDSAK